MSSPTLAVVNPAAGGGRCGKLAGAALDRLRSAGIELEIAETKRSGEGTSVAREAWARGVRDFLAVGGDGTSFEIVNGLFPEALEAGGGERPRLGFLPLGTGNSFLRDFSDRGADYAEEALVTGQCRSCDVLRLRHKGGELYFINLLSMGFAADVAAITNRRFKFLGANGYLLGVVTCLARLRRRAFPLRVDGQGEFDGRRCLFLSFNNSKFTGGTMLIAPHADPCDGQIEFVRWGPIGRLGLLANLHTLYDGTHLKHVQAERRAARRVEFDLEGPVDVMVDGESLALQCEELQVLPGALDVMA